MTKCVMWVISLLTLVMLVAYHFLGKTGWSRVVENGTRRILNGNIHGDALVPFPRLFLGR